MSSFLEKAIIMGHKLSQYLFRQIRDVLKYCIGFSFDEAYAVVEKQLGQKLDHDLFEQVHCTLVHIGYLREVGFCVSYAKETSVTFTWVDYPLSHNYHTDLMIVLEINHRLQHLTGETPLRLAL